MTDMHKQRIENERPRISWTEAIIGAVLYIKEALKGAALCFLVTLLLLASVWFLLRGTGLFTEGACMLYSYYGFGVALVVEVIVWTKTRRTSPVFRAAYGATLAVICTVYSINLFFLEVVGRALNGDGTF